jgi:hypothetical protein
MELLVVEVLVEQQEQAAPDCLVEPMDHDGAKRKGAPR